MFGDFQTKFCWITYDGDYENHYLLEYYADE